MTFQTELERLAGQTRLPASLPKDWPEACSRHFELLVAWNKTHNLTRVTEPTEAAAAHYLDCLAAIAVLGRASRVVDVGSGAGFPGLLVALAWPGVDVFLVEPARKRASFLEVASQAMGVPVLLAEAEAPLVVSRATFSVGKRGELRRYLSPGGSIAVFGHARDLPAWADEVAGWGGFAASSRHYFVPTLGERALLVARRC